MSGLMFLLVALVLSLVGSVALWLRHREPTSVERSVEDFSKEMDALAPPPLRQPSTDRPQRERRA